MSLAIDRERSHQLPPRNSGKPSTEKNNSAGIIETAGYGEDPQGAAPGAPGAPATWAHADKSGVGCAISPVSNVWFSLAQGIVTEVYHPDPSQAALRDIGLIVTDGKEFFSEEKTDTIQEVERADPGVPAYRLLNTCKDNRYRIEKEIITDPSRDVLLQRVRFTALRGKLEDFRLFAIASPRLQDRGAGNYGWAARYKGRPMLFARRGSHALAFAASCGWLRRSVGFVGASDPWLGLHRNKQMMWCFQRADGGHIALGGEIDLARCGGEFLLATGFDADPDAAALCAILSLEEDFDALRFEYIKRWQQWQRQLVPLDRKNQSSTGETQNNLYRASTMVLCVHRTSRFGSAVASLAVPWGNHRGDDETGGYHLVWTRDMAESASGLLAAGAQDEIVHTLKNLRAIQEADGHWPQDMWANGCSHAKSVQLDETALPILLLELAHRNGVISDEDLQTHWPMIRAAAGYIARNGPVTQEDRWENTPGYSPFTLAVEIAALFLASQFAHRFEKPTCGEYLRDLADEWNSRIEEWTYARGTEIAKRLNIDGHYVRIALPDHPLNQDPQASNVVSIDALALVRYGLRDPKDPRILNTIRAIDELTRVQTPFGPSWHRYNGDHYGEHDDGTAPIHGRTEGHGRAWPLLTGERGHYEVAAGNLEGAQELLKAIEGFAGKNAFIPEQVWDAPDLPDRNLFIGHPTGSAMPLAWAHAEYIRLLRSIRDGVVFDLPPAVHQRYAKDKTDSRHRSWRFDAPIHEMPAGKRLRISVLAPALIRFSTDDWHTFEEIETRDTHLGIHFADLPSERLDADRDVVFTFCWLPQRQWEGKDFRVHIVRASSP